MANLVHVAGLALIKISFGGSGYLELGYTRNGADITHEGFFLDVPGDENGGDEGPPIEIQFLGEIARVRWLIGRPSRRSGRSVRSPRIASPANRPGGPAVRT